MNGILIRVPLLPHAGMALFPFILLRKDVPPGNNVLLRHERIHLRQQIETGILFFYIWYLLEYGYHLFRFRSHSKAYQNICFEREAYARQSDTNYLRIRRHWAFMGFGKKGS